MDSLLRPGVMAAVFVAWAVGATISPAVAEPPRAGADTPRRLPGEYSGFEPVVAADGEGRVVVAAMDGQSHGMVTCRIVTWTSADGGKTFDKPRVPLDAGSGRQFDPWIKSPGSGRFLLSFVGPRDKEQTNRVDLLRSDDGGWTWKPTQVFGTGAAPDRPVFAMSPDGKRGAAVSFWAGDFGDTPRDVLFSSDGGASWAPERAPLRPARSAGFEPTGVVVNDDGRTIVGYRLRDASRGSLGDYSLHLGVTADGGRTWRRHDLGRLTGPSESPEEKSADIRLTASQVGLAQDGAGAVHVLTAQRAEKVRGETVVWYRRSADGERWVEPVELSRSRAPLKAYPAVAAAGQRVHAVWLEVEDGWCSVWYRGSADGGKSWSDRVAVSKPDKETDLLTDKGFRAYSGHYLGVAEDGRGTAHIVWAIRAPSASGDPPTKGEVWHTIVRLNAPK